MKRLLVIAATAATIAAATAGCGGAGRASVENGTAPASDSLRVGLVEWRIVTSSTTITAGVDHRCVTNAGTIVHNLYVNGGDPGLSPLSRNQVAGLWADSRSVIPQAEDIIASTARPAAAARSAGRRSRWSPSKRTNTGSRTR